MITISCKVFEDNNATIELATKPKFRPQTKHMATKYHHFRDSVKNGAIKVLPIDSLEKVTDIFTKALYQQKSKYLGKKFIGW